MMNSLDDFFITLTSDSCMDIFPDNTTGSFRVLLNKELYLHNYKVALNEIIFPTKIRNVSRSNNTITYGFKNLTTGNETTSTCEIPVGIYRTIEDLVKVINDTLQEKTGFNNVMKTVKSRVLIGEEFETFLEIESLKEGAEHQYEYIVSFENRLARMLGFKPNVNIFGKPASYESSIDEGFPHAMYIYSDLIDHQYIGGTVAPILKIIPLNISPSVNTLSYDKFGRRNRVEFYNPNYLKLSHSDCRTITIECRDAQSNPIAFDDGGCIIITLHFVRNKSL